MFQSTLVVGRHHFLIVPSSARALIGSLKMVKTKSSHYYSTNEQQPQDSPTELDNNKHNNANPKGDDDDVMTHSFGEAYASRSEEEGFGGTIRVDNNTSSEDDKMMNDDSSNRVN